MSTSISQMGPNSVALSYSGGTTLAQLLSALDNAMTTQGWSIFDSAAGTNAHCYRSAIADGTVAYKYLVLDISQVGYLLCKVYESWNATTHVGLNMAVNSDQTTYNQLLTLTTGGVVYIFANPRYALFYSKTSSLVFGSPSYATFSGCIEISRDNADEVPGVTPIFGWINGGLVTGSSTSGAGTYSMALPRTRAGAVAAAAQIYQSIGTIFGRSVMDNTTNYFQQLGKQIPQALNPFSPTNNIVLTPYSIDQGGPNYSNNEMHVRGRLYGIKILARGIGSLMDVTQIKTDSLGFFDPNSSVETPHSILGETSWNFRYAVPL